MLNFGLLAAKKKSPKPIPKWQVVENIVAAIERARMSSPDVRVTQKAMLQQQRGKRYPREVDVLVDGPWGTASSALAST